MIRIRYREIADFTRIFNIILILVFAHVRLSEVEASVSIGAPSTSLRMTNEALRQTSVSYENECPSPDRSGNPFVSAAADTKDWSG